MAKRKRKASLHSAGKVQEGDILARARAARDDPDLVTPHCDGGCVFFSPMKAARRGIQRVYAARDDASKLQGLTRKGSPIARAYAATILLANEGKAPYIAELKLPGIVAPYISRGKTAPLYLAGVQNHDDRQLRLLSVLPFVKKRGLHVYSADRGLVCTAKRDAPPRDFVQEEMAALDLFTDGADRYTCGHADADALLIEWKSAGVTIERCSACFDHTPTLANLLRHMAVPNARASFVVNARLRPLKGEPSGQSAITPVDATTRTAYAAGQLTDAEVLDAARSGRLSALRSGTSVQLILGNISYGADVDAFMKALSPTPHEDRALRAALALRSSPLVVDKPTAARALGELWPEHAREMLLAAAAGDADVAMRLHREKVSSEEAANLIRRAGREGAERGALSKLPRYHTLPPAAAVADSIARAFRGGTEAAVREALARAATGKAKGVALAFLDALGAKKGQEWRFTPSDEDVAASVAPAIDALLRGEPERYHDALRDACSRAGETSTFAPK